MSEQDLSDKHPAKDIDNTAKRLIALGYLGCHIEMNDGHFWITGRGTDDDAAQICELSNTLYHAGVMLNDKVYGGVLEALACIDQALELAGHLKLLDVYERGIRDMIICLGEYKPSGHNVRKVEKGMGGVM